MHMRIGLDGYPLVWPKTGVAHYTLELALELARLAPAHSFELIAPAAYPPEVLEQINQAPNLRAVSVKTNIITRRWWAVGLPRYLRRSPVDLFHGTNYEVPLRNRERNVLTVHDLSVFSYPETHDRRIGRRARRRLPIMIRSAARIITPTEAVKGELVERFAIDPDIVTVTPEAPRKIFQPMTADETAAARRRLGISDDFILFVGTIEPRKNLGTLLMALIYLFRKTRHRSQLVIAGPKGWLRDDFDELLDTAKRSKRLRYLGYVGDDDLRALYSSCKAFVYPSLYEGFGLPPLEAMACGAPVIASQIDALIETLGGSAHFVDPADEHALAGAIVNLLERPDERERMSRSGLEHAARFSWAQTAKLTLRVYDRLLGKTLSA
jgi:glycosyltransferase involved in cell wall biosynthesis